MSKGHTDTTLQTDTPSNPRLVPSHLILPGNARTVDLKLNVSAFLVSLAIGLDWNAYLSPAELKLKSQYSSTSDQCWWRRHFLPTRSAYIWMPV